MSSVSGCETPPCSEQEQFKEYGGTNKKVLGAFYTPDRYVKIAAEMVRAAIADAKKQGFADYIILDRCAGSGNLLRCFNKEELSHCIVNAYEMQEWVVLTQLYADKVRRIIPHNDKHKGGDALAEYFLDYFAEEFRLRDEGKLAVIMLENPPYSDVVGCNSGANKGDNTRNGSAHTFIKNRMKALGDKYLSDYARDVCNQFIWSAYADYKPIYYILYAPVKYWKSNHIIDKKFIGGYLCNRKFFHATEGGISLICWANVNENNDTLTLKNAEDDGVVS